MVTRSGVQPTAVKITDVAAAAGVAPMTVSRVLNTPERVSDATARRVRDAIEKLGYVPNLIAGSLSSRRSRLIAAIVPSMASPMFYEPVGAFTETLEQAGYHVMLGMSGYALDNEEALIRAVLARRPDGMLLTGTAHSPAVLRLLRDAGVPVVEIWDTNDAPVDMLVGFDHAELGAAVADFFLTRGHREFAALFAGDARAAQRRDGFVARLGQHGGRLVAERTLPPSTSIQAARQGFAEIAGALGERTALFCSSDSAAYGALVEAQARGMAVPERVAICGFGDFDLSRACHLPFTTVNVDGPSMGRRAAENLLARMTGRPTPRRVLVPFRIVAREST